MKLLCKQFCVFAVISASLFLVGCNKSETLTVDETEQINVIDAKKSEDTAMNNSAKPSDTQSTTREMPEGIYLDANSVQPLSVGQLVPDFTVQTAEGISYAVNPQDLQKPVVLTFFRGGWCPYCNVQLAEMRTAEAELRALGFDVWFMSIDKPELLYESLKEPNISYTLFSDANLEATKTFGIGFKVDAETIKTYTGYGINLEEASGKTHHVLPAPSTFIIGMGGRVHYQYTNPDYTVRLAPEELLIAANKYVDFH